MHEGLSRHSWRCCPLCACRTVYRLQQHQHAPVCAFAPCAVFVCSVCATLQDKAEADKERVAAELAAMGTEVVDAIKKAGADARAAKKDKKNAKGGADKVCGGGWCVVGRAGLMLFGMSTARPHYVVPPPYTPCLSHPDPRMFCQPLRRLRLPPTHKNRLLTTPSSPRGRRQQRRRQLPRQQPSRCCCVFADLLACGFSASQLRACSAITPTGGDPYIMLTIIAVLLPPLPSTLTVVNVLLPPPKGLSVLLRRSRRLRPSGRRLARTRRR